MLTNSRIWYILFFQFQRRVKLYAVLIIVCAALLSIFQMREVSWQKKTWTRCQWESNPGFYISHGWKHFPHTSFWLYRFWACSSHTSSPPRSQVSRVTLTLQWNPSSVRAVGRRPFLKATAAWGRGVSVDSWTLVGSIKTENHNEFKGLWEVAENHINKCTLNSVSP